MKAIPSLLGLLASLAVLIIVGHSRAGGKVNVLILVEHGVGSSAQAQPHVDKLIKLAAERNDWPAAEGKYITRRAQAKKYIEDRQPAFGFLSLAAYLAMRNDVEVVGQADVTHAGGRRYHLISKTASSLAECKGKTLASNHADDERFINKVVGRGSFELSDFTVMETRRPVQTIKKVIKGKAVCALIDNAQHDELAHIDGGSSVRAVWSSSKLPPMAVVAFSGADTASRAKFKASLGDLCTGAGKGYCDKVGIVALKSADKSAYAAVLAAYEK